jgi:hypothetical protein
VEMDSSAMLPAVAIPSVERLNRDKMSTNY